MNDFQKEYQNAKMRKKLKHKNSKIRHPIKASKRKYNRVKKTEHDYWERGKILHHSENSATHSDDRKDVINAYKSWGIRQKIIYGIIAVIIIFFMIWGAIH